MPNLKSKQLKKKSPDSSTIDPNAPTELGVSAVAYVSLQEQKKRIDEDLKNLRVTLEGALQKNGVKDAKGNTELVVEHGGVKVALQYTVRRSTSLLPEAIKVAETEFSAEIAGELVETTKVFRMDRLEQMILEGTISESDARQFVQPSETTAFSVKKVKK